MGKYKTVVMDPPWRLRLAPGMKESLQGCTLRSMLPYATMDEKDIEQFAIDRYAAPKSLLFLWCPNGKIEGGLPCLHTAFHIIDSWGFTYRLILVWSKGEGPAIWQPFRSQAEFCLFATRGIANIPPYGQFSNVFDYPTNNRRIRGAQTHSEKPAAFYHLLRKWTPEPRIDLFARRVHAGCMRALMVGAMSMLVTSGRSCHFLNPRRAEGE